MLNNKGIVLTIVLIFMLVLSLVAAAAIALMTNQSQITELQIKRLKAYYTAQAGIVHNLQRLRQGINTAEDKDINGLHADVTFGAIEPSGMRKITATVNY